jgi:hypothetical protein
MQCRFILVVEYTSDDELIEAIGVIEKNLPGYDYASRPLPVAGGQRGGFKLLAFKELKLQAVRISPAYVSLTNVVSASPQALAGSILGERGYSYKLQLTFSEKALAPYTLTDEVFRDKRSVLYLNDVWQLVRGASK